MADQWCLPRYQWYLRRYLLNFRKFGQIKENQYIIYMITEAFWKRVKLLLKERNLTQAAAAKVCGRSLYTFKGWMSKNIIPPLDNAYDLAQLLGISLEYLITGKINNRAVNYRELVVMLKKTAEKLGYSQIPLADYRHSRWFTECN